MAWYPQAPPPEVESSEYSEDEPLVTLEMLKSGEGLHEEVRKDLEASIWGVTTLTIIRVSAFKFTPALMVKFTYAVCITTLNYWLQFTTLYYVNRYIVGDAVHATQKNYQQYHAEVFNPDKTFNDTLWESWDGPYMELCNLAMSKLSFTTVILFMWSGRMLAEARDIYAFVQDICGVMSLPKGATSADMVQSVDTDDGQQYNVVGMSFCCRFLIFIFVVLPKSVIAATLLYIGSRWLTATESFSDLILNALALEFVIGTDELVYEGFSPAMLKSAIEITKLCQLKPIELKTESEILDGESLTWVVLAYGRSFVMVVCCMVFVLLYMNMFQSVIPSYPYDVAPNCHGWFEKRYDPLCPIGTADPMSTCFPYGTAIGQGS